MAIHPNCHLIAITGGKGGVGKSVVAANLSLAFMIELKAPVLLIDADNKSCGDQNVITGVRPNKTLGELASFAGTLNQQSLETIVSKHPSGLHFLGAVRGPEEVFSVDADMVMKQIDNLSKFYRFIVVDLGNDIGALQMNFISESSALLVISNPEILAVNQTLRQINDLMAATLPSDLIQVIVNKSSQGALAPQTISSMLRKPILTMIPQDDITTGYALQRSQPFVVNQPRAPITAVYHDLVRKLSGGLLQKMKALAKPKLSSITDKSEGDDGNKKGDPKTLLKLQIHNELIEAMDLKKGITDTKGDPNKEKMLRAKTQQVISQIVDKLSPGLGREERSQIIKEVLDEALGLGPLEDLLADLNVTEIMVNGHHRIFVEKSGKIQMSAITFTSNLHLRNVIERIVTPLGRRIDEKTPYVDARLKDGSRVNAIIEPLSIDGPALTIRKFAKDPITPANYIHWQSMTRQMIDFIKICVENGLNVVISGGTGSGKTTLLNVMSSFIPSDERIITVEDAAELQLKQEHVVRLETRPASMEGSGAVTIRDLIKNALRMRPDRIIVGECRDGAALDMLQAMNTGHDGSMTTTHANSPRECIARLETLCLMAGMDLPIRAIREQISGAVNLIVQISRLSDGSRKVISVTEVCGMQGETITLQEIFRFKEEGFDKNRKIVGQFQPMGLIPTFIEKLEQKGVIIPRDIFTSSVKATPEDDSQKNLKKGITPTLGLKKPMMGTGGQIPTPTPHPHAPQQNDPSLLKKASGGETK